MKKQLILYRVFTGLFALSILSGAIFYFVDYPHVSGEFKALGFPLFIIYPLAIAKILGVVGIIQKQSKILKEWAYAGFTFNLLLASGAHAAIGDGKWFPPLMVLGFMFLSYWFSKKVAHQPVAEA